VRKVAASGAEGTLDGEGSRGTPASGSARRLQWIAGHPRSCGYIPNHGHCAHRRIEVPEAATLRAAHDWHRTGGVHATRAVQATHRSSHGRRPRTSSSGSVRQVAHTLSKQTPTRNTERVRAGLLALQRDERVQRIPPPPLPTLDSTQPVRQLRAGISSESCCSVQARFCGQLDTK